MNKFVKEAASFVLLPVYKLYKHTVIKVAKNEAVLYYKKIVITARQAFVGVICLLCWLGLLFSGFLMIHISALLYVSIVMGQTKLALIGLLVLGVFYLSVSLAVILKFCSEKSWLKYSKCDEYLEKFTRPF